MKRYKKQSQLVKSAIKKALNRSWLRKAYWDKKLEEAKK